MDEHQIELVLRICRACVASPGPGVRDVLGEADFLLQRELTALSRVNPAGAAKFAATILELRMPPETNAAKFAAVLLLKKQMEALNAHAEARREVS